MACSQALSQGVYPSDECYSPWEGSLKGSPRQEIPTFNLHTVSISTVYQSDNEDTLKGPREDGSGTSHAVGTPVDTAGICITRSFNGTLTEDGITLEACMCRVENGVKTNDLLNRSIQEFCNIGFEYVDRLQGLVDRMNLTFPGESSGAVASIDAFKSYIGMLVKNQRDFLDAVSHECIIPEQCSEACAEIKRDIEHSRLKYAETEAERASLAASVEDLYMQSKSAVSMCSEAFHEPPLMKTRLHGALIPIFLKFMHKNRELADMSSNQSRLEFDAETERLKNSLRGVDHERIIALRDCLSKFMVYETARVRNTQYDMSTLVNALNVLEPEDEWSAFETGGHLEVDTSASNSLTHTTRHYTSYLTSAIPEVFRNYAISRLTLSAPKERVIQRVERTLSKYVDAVWDDNPASISVKDFVGEMQSSLVRQIFCNMVTAYSLRSNRLKSISALRLLSRMIAALLSFSQRQRDAWSGYSVLRVSDFIHIVNEGQGGTSERCSLRMLIHGHEYWSSIPFWEECLLIVIAQDLKVLFEEGRGHELLQPATKQLKDFKKWMLGFGINPVETQALIARVCGQMGLPEDYARLLLDSSDA